MLIIGWVMALGMLTLLFSNILEKQRNPNTQLSAIHNSDGSKTITLQRNRAGHYLTSGTINGQPVEFMLDTGASDVSIPGNIAKRIGLKRGSPRFYETANGTIKAYSTMLDRVGIGELELRQIRGSINPHMGGETILLGMSVLKQLEFTQRGDTLIIRQYQ